MVRAKFKCESKLERDGGNFEVNLRPVYSSDPASENAKFYKATPSGEIKLSTTNPAAAEQFVPGKEYYVDFTPAESAKSA